MKILLLGKNGMLGSQFLKILSGSSDFEMYAFSKDDLDITNKSDLDNILNKISPDFLINCAAYTAVDECETNKDLAFNINADAVKKMAEICDKKNICLIHFSTDYVFDGSKEQGYKENDIPSPINIYGESKLKGEKFITKNMSKYYIIRTSWLFGENGKNFVDTMIKLAKERPELNIVDDQIGSPTYTKDLAEAVSKYFLNPLKTALFLLIMLLTILLTVCFIWPASPHGCISPFHSVERITSIKSPSIISSASPSALSMSPLISLQKPLSISDVMLWSPVVVSDK